ncbi:hypothetical protein WUBG_16863 [Wuchereria bancrofti]|uniref:PI3K/PI4K catalytic domain-containing protein n=1 Tax=Wuchereria bancrofti TaxID=6293 RepID=J9DRK9_WUCBA|nr:hypothetical protein WUBG_16863 [Wuchereria bancrofti]
MQNMISPLDISNSLGALNIELCKVIGSAKQPLRLAWTNPEPLARLHSETHQIIFKNGDDLRQDMLTLQVMRIMDALWKSQDYDLCLSIYEVLPMGRNHLQKELASYVEIMQNMISPLDISNSLGALNIELCKVIGSAKQPLRLAWTNPEPLARLHSETHQIIFKNGDGRYYFL